MTTTTTTGSGQNYTVNLCYYPDEPIYDFDELVCMYHQFLAIEFGWADPIKVHIIYPEENRITYWHDGDGKWSNASTW